MPWNVKRYLRANKEWRDRKKLADPNWWNARNKRYRDSVRDRLLAHYGGSCQCCGETMKEFLEFDHINGGGTKERREHSTMQIYLRLLRELPTDIRILCSNCNHARAKYGECPHEREAVPIAV